MTAPLIIPIFITHQGCPHRCLFCNQQPITASDGQSGLPAPEAVAAEIRAWLLRSPPRGRRVQVGFYGGSFTGLPLACQRRLLLAVAPFRQAGSVDSIRLSTRPDYVQADTPGFLRELGVDTVELGVQSMQPEVLARNRRGHGVEQTEEAIATLKAAGLTTGVQLMLGLPGEISASTLAGARRLARLGPDFARLHPTLVIEGSGLAALYHQGGYRPLTLNQAVALGARVSAILTQHGVAVIRCGLQPSPELAASLVAGPHHPAFGELVKARLLFNELRRRLHARHGRPCRLTLAEQDRSLLYGHRQAGIKRLERLQLLEQTTIVFSKEGIERGKVRVEIESP